MFTLFPKRPAYDVVIVGSGAGGGMAAYELTKAGATVCVLEAGGPWDNATDWADRNAAQGVLADLFTAMRLRDTVALQALFVPGARLVGMRQAATGTSRLQAITPQQFAQVVASDTTRGPWIERMWSPTVTVDGTLASIWAPYDFHFGTTFSHRGASARHR